MRTGGVKEITDWYEDFAQCHIDCLQSEYFQTNYVSIGSDCLVPIFSPNILSI